MNIGLYFGSFNPVHVGHLIIANHVLNATDVQKIWFIVSPQNPFKNTTTLLNEYDRLHLAKLAIENDNRISASDIEFKLPRPSYTIDTLAYLSEKYPDHQFSIIMGSDSYQNLEKWKNHHLITKNYHLYIYIRPGFGILPNIEHQVTILKAPLLEISATEIRTLVKEGKSIRYLVPENVMNEIEQNRYFKK
ncbi:MAG: nicotinate (nicotinamide) nucleotide adenylyltransferase [Chitinophagaceae bacterium]